MVRLRSNLVEEKIVCKTVNHELKPQEQHQICEGEGAP